MDDGDGARPDLVDKLTQQRSVGQGLAQVLVLEGDLEPGLQSLEGEGRRTGGVMSGHIRIVIIISILIFIYNIYIYTGYFIYKYM